MNSEKLSEIEAIKNRLDYHHSQIQVLSGHLEALRDDLNNTADGSGVLDEVCSGINDAEWTLSDALCELTDIIDYAESDEKSEDEDEAP